MSGDPVTMVDTACLHGILAATKGFFPYAGSNHEMKELLEQYYSMGPPYVLPAHAMADIAAILARLHVDLIQLLGPHPGVGDFHEGWDGS